MSDDQKWLRSYVDSDGYSIISHAKSGKVLSLYNRALPTIEGKHTYYIKAISLAI